MTKASANKTSQVEFGNTLNGYFAKEYVNYFQIFGPCKQPWLKVYKTSNDECKYKVEKILTLLNEQSKALIGDTAAKPGKVKSDNSAFRVAELEQLVKELQHELHAIKESAKEGRAELLERRQESAIYNDNLRELLAERNFLRQILSNLTSK